jgi:cytidylate kinase
MNMTPHDKYKYIYKIHTSQLNLLATSSDNPFFVVFSAIPGSGKSEISKRLESDYGYLRITNKLIRESIAKSGYEDITIGDYTIWFLEKLTKDYRPNIVFDRNIDQWYEPSKDWAEKNSYGYVVVAIDVSIGILERRLFNREGTMKSKAHEMLDFYSQQHKEKSKLILATILLNDDYSLDDAAKLIADAGA